MSEKEVLNLLYDRIKNELLIHSANDLMTIPKKGFEKEWQEEKEIIDWITDLKNRGEL